MTRRALVFDVFGTLVDWRSGLAEAFRRAGVPSDAEQLADAWRARGFKILAEVNAGSRPWSNFDALNRLALDELLSKQGIYLDLEARHRLIGAWHRLDPWPDVPAGLETLRRDHTTATLSNGHVALMIDLARHSDLRFDCLLSSELARVYKPAAAVYQTGAHLLGLQPAELMLVAAHPWDLEGARGAGLRTAFVDRPLEHGPGSPARADPDADESVTDLHELARRLM